MAKNKALLVQQLKSEKEAIIQLKTEEHKICDLLTAQQKAALLAEALRRGEARLNELTVMKVRQERYSCLVAVTLRVFRRVRSWRKTR